MFAYVAIIGTSGIVLNTLLMSLGRTIFRGQMAAARDTA
jgi:hypothetical protein